MSAVLPARGRLERIHLCEFIRSPIGMLVTLACVLLRVLPTRTVDCALVSWWGELESAGSGGTPVNLVRPEVRWLAFVPFHTAVITIPPGICRTGEQGSGPAAPRLSRGATFGLTD